MDETVIAFHVVMSFYGFWLPNDERGSGSWYVGSKSLYQFSTATHVSSNHSVARRPYNKAIQLQARKNLKYPSVVLNGYQARAIGRGFANYIDKSGLIVHACAILPDHVHLVVRRFTYSIEQIMIKLKAAATEQLLREGLHPFQRIVLPDGGHPKVFARDGRHVFIFDNEGVIGRIKYVCDNPVNAGLPAQEYPFVIPFISLSRDA
ncbi:MAG TPA: hypothetical protein VHD56_09670 [Tepidisphaeraceae bacterium]|nr:hypothetical protein [Tepidisphaeraceae bacterium]